MGKRSLIKTIILLTTHLCRQISNNRYQSSKYLNNFKIYKKNFQTKLIPIPIYRGPDFEERLREIIDVD
jgi:hypothetical protein